MGALTSVMFGAFSLFGWGVCDFLAALSSRKIGNVRSLFWMTGGGLLLMLFFLPLSHLSIPSPTRLSWVMLITAGFMQATGGLAFYKALTVGKVSLASPVSASWSMWTVVLSVVFLGETLTRLQPYGIILVILGTILVSTNIGELLKESKFIFSDPGVKFAVAASVLWGTSFVIYSPVVRTYGWLIPSILLRSLILISVVLWSIFMKTKLSFKPEKKDMMLLGVMSIVDVVAYFGYSLGLEKGLTAIVSPVAAAFPLITILLARIILKEKPVANQFVGVVGIILGIILLAV